MLPKSKTEVGMSYASDAFMFKIAAFAFVPVVVATFYSQEDPKPPMADYSQGSAVEEQDRQFLAAVSRQEISSGSAERADQAFLAKLQAEERRLAAAARLEIPVMRAIAVERPLPLAPVASGPAPAAAIDSLGEAHEVRRALPVARTAPVASASIADPRNALRQPFVTMIEPDVRQNIGGDRPRASILISGDEVVVRQ